MTKLDFCLILFLVDYLKEVLVPETNKLLKHPMDPVEFIWWLDLTTLRWWPRATTARNDQPG